MSEPVEREYRYRPGLYFLWASPLFFGLMCGTCVYFELTNTEPVYLQGVLEYPAVVANVTAWLLAVLFAVLLAGTMVFVVQALTRRQRVALTATALLVPKGFWSSQEQAIPYGDITQLVPHTGADGTRTIFVMHPQGKFPLTESLLPSRATFEELTSTLASRVGGRPQGG